MLKSLHENLNYKDTAGHGDGARMRKKGKVVCLPILISFVQSTRSEGKQLFFRKIKRKKEKKIFNLRFSLRCYVVIPTHNKVLLK